MKRCVQSPWLRSKLRVMLLHGANIVAEPYRYLKDRWTTFVRRQRIEQTGESMAHRVGRYPFAFLRFHVFPEWPGEIVTVTVLAVLLVLGMQHERLAQAVGVEKGDELVSEGNRAF